MKKICLLICMSLLALFCFADVNDGKEEILKTDWPDEYNWKVLQNQNDDFIRFTEIIPGNEDENNWTLIGTMTAIKKIGFSLDSIINMYQEASRSESRDAKFTIIEKDNNNKFAIFKIEAEKYKDDDNPESSLHIVILGRDSVYTNTIGIKQAKLSESFESKWIEILKKYEIIYQ